MVATPENKREPLSDRNSRSDRRDGARWQKTSPNSWQQTSPSKENLNAAFLEGRDESGPATLKDIKQLFGSFSSSITEEFRKVGKQVDSVAVLANSAKQAAIAAELHVAALEGELHHVRDQVTHMSENMEAQVRELFQIEVNKQQPASSGTKSGRWRAQDGWEQYHKTTDDSSRDETMARELVVTGFEHNSSRPEIKAALEMMLGAWGGSEEAAFAPKEVGSLGIIRFLSRSDKMHFKKWSGNEELRNGAKTLKVRHNESKEERVRGRAMSKAKRAMIEAGVAEPEDIHFDKRKDKNGAGIGAVFVKKNRACKWTGEVMVWRTGIGNAVKEAFEELMQPVQREAADSMSEDE